jgi:hypothetical protein
MKTFWILWVFNSLMSLVPVYFFLEGLADGTVSIDNIGIWLIMLVVIGFVLGGSYWLKNNNKLGMAKAILIVAAIPGGIAILFLAILLIEQPRWN